MNNYRLENEQYETLVKLVKERPVVPLHFLILSEEFLGWKSFTNAKECELKATLDAAIKHLIDGLERRFGLSLVKHLLGMDKSKIFTCSKPQSILILRLFGHLGKWFERV